MLGFIRKLTPGRKVGWAKKGGRKVFSRSAGAPIGNPPRLRPVPMSKPHSPNYLHSGLLGTYAHVNPPRSRGLHRGWFKRKHTPPVRTQRRGLFGLEDLGLAVPVSASSVPATTQTASSGDGWLSSAISAIGSAASTGANIYASKQSAKAAKAQYKSSQAALAAQQQAEEAQARMMAQQRPMSAGMGGTMGIISIVGAVGAVAYIAITQLGGKKGRRRRR